MSHRKKRRALAWRRWNLQHSITPILQYSIPILLTGSAFATGPPQAADSSIQITLLAEHPHVRTPTGLDVAADGRIYVLENNTHFRPEDYAAPDLKSDRILAFTDPGDGTPAPPPTVFHEGLVWGTDLAISSTGWIYVSTRKEIYRLRDTDDDGVAEDIRGVIDLDSPGEYPHNGISGLCFDASGNLSFGLGENLGEPYTLIGSDGAKLSGEGEGGSTYRCQYDGSDLQRIATGVWNPFGMDYDSVGNLFATDNDPGSCPPNRLLHIVEGADFGYEFRYGRTGLHPLVTWTGEFSGTSSMVTGIGEAACGVIAFGTNQLIISSWADHRIDRYELIPKGATFTATRHPFLQGGNEFRPVDIAMAPDRRTFYISDWVSSSYPVHGQGRVWRMRLELPIPPTTDRAHPEIAHAASIRQMNSAGQIPGLVQLLDNEDPQIRNAAIHALASIGPALEKNLPESFLETPLQRAGALVALKRTGDPAARERIPSALKDPDADVRFTAIKWVADDKLEQYRPQLDTLLRDPRLDARLFLAVMAAIDRVDGKKPSDIPATPALMKFAADTAAPPSLRATALALIPPSEYKELPINYLKPLLVEESATLRLEAIRSLASHPDPARGPLLATVAGDDGQLEDHRAEAIVGLAFLADQFRGLLDKLATGPSPILRDEAQRALIGSLDPALAAISGAPTTTARKPEPKPAPAELDAWLELLGDPAHTASRSEAGMRGDIDTGRRIFFHPKVGTCARCHRMEGRGTSVGPDLTTIWKRSNPDDDPIALQRWLLESILTPSATIAPQFLPWEIMMTDGSTRIGLPLRKGGDQEAYLGIDGRDFSLLKPEIKSHRELPISLMPAGLLEQLTTTEIQDLLAYLMEPK